LRQQLDLDGFYIVGDAAYGTNCEYVLCPYKGRAVSLEKDAWNYYQSAHRVSVERAFEQLTTRWGVFWKPLQSRRQDRAILIIRAAAALHNLCVDAEVATPPVHARRWTPRQRTASAKRDALTRRLARARLVRPPLPSYERLDG